MAAVTAFKSNSKIEGVPVSINYIMPHIRYAVIGKSVMTDQLFS